jgi:DNA processing protein
LSREETLAQALAVFAKYRTPNAIKKAVRNLGFSQMAREIDPSIVRGHQREATLLVEKGIGVVSIDDDLYPKRLALSKDAPAVLFTWGNQRLLGENGIGMCGSRNVSERGLDAARTCGLEVAGHGLVIVSGYARGVDTETHLAALESGGKTIIVLAEGINGFKRKRAFDKVPFDEDHVLVVSQFSPDQRWNVGAAMTRNGVIVGLGSALVVIEAGETGGTLNAGLRALSSGKPVLALSFSTQATPLGNKTLIEKGAVPIESRQHLGRVLDAVGAADTEHEVVMEQLRLLDGQ